MTYHDLRDAAALFGLGERATLKEIKTRHRHLAKRHHPDHGGSGDPAAMQQVNRAFRILADYCAGYRYCFSEEEFLEQHPEERLRRQFGWDPVWSGKASEE